MWESKCCKPFGVAAIFEARYFEPGSTADFIGVNDQGEHFTLEVTIQAISLLELPNHNPPRWRERNLEAVSLVDDPPATNSGILCNENGVISALYTVAPGVDSDDSASGYCLPSYTILPVLEHLRRNGPMNLPLLVPSLELQFGTVKLHRLQMLPARLRPSVKWFQKLSALGSTALNVVSVVDPSNGSIMVGDLLVAVQGEVVTSAQAVEAKLEELKAEMYSRDQPLYPLTADVTLLRRGQEINIAADVRLLGGDGTRRVLCWHGLVLHEIPRFISEVGPVPDGVSIAHMMLGTPSEAHGVEGDFLVAVDGPPTSSLDAIVALSCKKT